MAVDSRSTLLMNSLQLFARKGYENVGVQEIVVSSGVTKPTLYHHFGNKIGLLESLYREGFAPLNSRLDALKAQEFSAADLQTMLEQICIAYFDFTRENPLFMRLYMAMLFAPEESDACQVVMPHATRQHQTVSSIMIRLGIPAEKAPFMTARFIGQIKNHVSWFLMQRGELDLAAAQNMVLCYLYGALHN